MKDTSVELVIISRAAGANWNSCSTASFAKERSTSEPSASSRISNGRFPVPCSSVDTNSCGTSARSERINTLRAAAAKCKSLTAVNLFLWYSANTHARLVFPTPRGPMILMHEWFSLSRILDMRSSSSRLPTNPAGKVGSASACVGGTFLMGYNWPRPESLYLYYQRKQ